MADILLVVDTAVVVPVNKAPLVDDTDFKTREAVAYNAAGMDLRWNFVTAAGAVSSTAVTPTTAGTYDWTDLGDGMMSIEIPASGGASINNDTEGFGWFTGVATGVAPWVGPIIQFSPANVVNSLVSGADRLEVSAMELNNSAALLSAFVKNVGEIYEFTVTNTGFSPTATEFETSSITEATANHYVDCLVVWTSGALKGKRMRVNAYSLSGGRGHFTMTDKGEAPGNGDTGILV